MKMIPENTVVQVRSQYGYTVKIKKFNSHEKVIAEVNLKDVFDLSWTQADKLDKILTDFIDKELPKIYVDDTNEIDNQIKVEQATITRINDSLAKANLRLAKLLERKSELEESDDDLRD